MKRFISSIFHVLMVAAAATSAPPDVPKSIESESGDIAEIQIRVMDDKDIGYRLVGPKAMFREVKSDVPGERVFWFHSRQDGVYSIVWWTVGEKSSSVTTITVGKPSVPIPPKPKPDDAPIKANGLHVLVVYDPDKLATMTEAQKSAIFSKDVRDYLNATCPKTVENGKAGWQMWPSGTDTSLSPKLWQDAYKRERRELPWVIVSNGTTGFEGPLPQSASDMLSLLRKFGDK